MRVSKPKICTSKRIREERINITTFLNQAPNTKTQKKSFANSVVSKLGFRGAEVVEIHEFTLLDRRLTKAQDPY